MKNIEKFYKNTENALPHVTVRKFIEMKTKPGNAIDLGCGSGRDTIFLIKNGWNVLAIDRENTEEIIMNQLKDKEIKRFKFSKQNFENLELQKADLVVANFSIPFCNKENFYEFWKKIVANIEKGGYFVGNFFGLNDSWTKLKKEMTFLSKLQTLELFNNLFEILEFEEIEEDGKTGLGKMKHWHIFNIVAKKK